MKRELLLAAVLGLSTISAFAQGELTVANTGTLVTVFGLGPAAPSLTNYKVQLYYQPDVAGSTAPGFLDFSSSGVPLNGWEAMSGAPIISIYPVAGRFAGGIETTGTDVAPNGMVYLEMVGWSGGYNSVQAAINGGAVFFGWSEVWSQASGTGAPGTPAAIANFFPGLVLTPGPEPSVIAISGLGIAAMLLHRRKKV